MEDKTKIDSALLQIPTPSNREKWLTISMAYKAAGGAYEIWDLWCKKGESYNQTENRITWNSFSEEGGITEKTLYKIAMENGWMPNEQETVRIQTENPVETMIRKAEKRQKEIIPYFGARGLTEATVRRFHIGYHPVFVLAGTREPRAIIPYPEDMYYTARRLSEAQDQDDKKYLYPKKTEAGGKRLFNSPALQHNIVFIVEGQLDAMSIEQCGYPAAGCNEAKQLVEALQNGGKANAFIIIPDDDETGRQKSQKMLDSLLEMQKTAKISPLPQGIHDANQFLCKNESELKEWLKNQQAELQKTNPDLAFAADSAAYMLRAFEKHAQSKKSMIPTGFTELDEKLGDGLYEGLYVIGAQSSVGTTTFCGQITDQIAQSGRDVIIFELDQSTNELIAKSLSRITAKIAAKDECKRTARELLHGHFYENMNEETAETLKIAKNMYREFAGNIYIKECETQPQAIWITDQIRKHIELHGKRPIVLIDKLENMAQEQHNTKENVFRLKRTARKFHIPVIAVSDPEEREETDGADVIIELRNKNTASSPEEPRMIEAVIRKQRFGEAEEVIEFQFNEKYNLFTEK